ncbi:putative transcription factor WD40-like family [Helianthus annuus]|nr:putative transcription factor WD40-like family [Helianthus annuus]KAJ0460081.1 putative transcription factor WD40-like family [Helianthus annuus]KAJ0640526.1 putative transcription factor WD40-like family [Helianthus annuus]KAJ0644461.1 putative transcription factor WD40-like family [Helianthus annuus]
MAFECKVNTDIAVTKDSEVDSNHIVSSGKSLVIDSETVVTNSGKLIHSAKLPIDACLLSDHRTIADLPPALISEIFNCLDPKELGVVSCVSPSLYRIASDHHVWKEFYCERWGLPTGVPVSLNAECSDERSWKALFVEREFRSKTFLGRYTIDTLYGHTEPVRTLFVLLSKKLIITSGYDSIIRMWDVEDGYSIASSRPLGCTIRAVAADSKLLIAGGSDGFIHGWRAEEGHPHLFDIKGPQNQNTEFRLWEHQGPITCIGLDSSRIYSGSWDMTIRVWDRVSLKCLTVLMHNDWVWSLVPHDGTVVSTSGSDVYIWETNTFSLIDIIKDAHVGNAYSLARSHTGNFIFTGGEDGAIHMFEITSNGCGSVRRLATWGPHTGPVYSLSFEFPWLVSASSDGKLSLIDVRKLLKNIRHSSTKTKKRDSSSGNNLDQKNMEPPQRMLHGSGGSLFCVGIGADRIICGGEEGTVRIWNFSQAFEMAKRVSALKALRFENRMRRRKLQNEMDSKGQRVDSQGQGLTRKRARSVG